MARSIEEILGKISHERAIPGTRPGEAEKVRYVSFCEPQKPDEVFEEVVWKLDPPIANNGGVVREGFIIRIPDGTPLYALRYHGDVSGWQKQIEQGAAELGLVTGKLDGDRFVLSDDRSFPLADCKVERG